MSGGLRAVGVVAVGWLCLVTACTRWGFRFPGGDDLSIGDGPPPTDGRGRRDGPPVDVLDGGSAGPAQWGKVIAAAGDQNAWAVTTDGVGGAFITGEFAATIDLGDGARTSSGYKDIFVARLDATGALRVARAFGNALDDDAGRAMARDVAGNIYLAGALSGTMTFGGGDLVSAGDSDAFIASFTPQLQHRWSRRYGGPGPDIAYGLTVGAGLVCLAGEFSEKADFGDGPQAAAGAEDAFIVCLDTQGKHRWSGAAGGGRSDAVRSVALDHAGNLFLCGSFGGRVDLGGGPLVSAGDRDLGVASFDPSGTHRWSRRFGGIGYDACRFVGVDGTGSRVVIAGVFQETVTFGNVTLESRGGGDVFVMGLTGQGTPGWVHRFGGVDGETAYGGWLDGNGEVLITGRFAGTAAFDDGATLDSAGGDDLFAARFGVDGTRLWSAAVGSPENDWGVMAVTDGRANYVVGKMADAALFDGKSLPSAGDADIAVFRLVMP